VTDFETDWPGGVADVGPAHSDTPYACRIGDCGSGVTVVVADEDCPEHGESETAELLRQITAAEREAAPGPRPPLDLDVICRILRTATHTTDLRIVLGTTLTEIERLRRANHRTLAEVDGLREANAQQAREIASLRDAAREVPDVA
jgi:hypothetical protein